MRIVAAAHWQPGPGALLDWTPTPATVAAAAAAPRHRVGPSFLQRDHIGGVLSGRAEGRTHRGYTCSAITVTEDLDVARMTAALTAFVRAHEGLRCTFRTGGGDVTRHVVAPADVELAAVPVGSGIDVHRHLDDRLPRDAVFDTFPAVAFGAISRPGSFDLYFAMDHAFGDGGSQMLGLIEIVTRYRAARDDGSPQLDLPTHFGSHVDHTATELARAAELTPESASVRVWRDVLGGNGLPRFPLPLGLDGHRPAPVRIHTEPLADAPDTAALAGLADDLGVGVTTLLYAALALTERELAGRTHYRTAAVLSTRGSGRHRWSQGWYCNFVPIAFDVEGERLADVVPAAAAAVATAKSMIGDPVHGAVAVLVAGGDLDPEAVASPQMVTYLDFRWFSDLPGVDDIVLFTGEGQTRNASLWITRDAGGLRIASQRPDNAVAAESVSRYMATLRAVLADAVGSGALVSTDRRAPACS